jgi:hypothetical protein
VRSRSTSGRRSGPCFGSAPSGMFYRETLIYWPSWPKIRRYPLRVVDYRPLVEILPEDSGLTSTYARCNPRQCGTCAALLDGALRDAFGGRRRCGWRAHGSSRPRPPAQSCAGSSVESRTAGSSTPDVLAGSIELGADTPGCTRCLVRAPWTKTRTRAPCVARSAAAIPNSP